MDTLVMRIPGGIEAEFVERPNRFLLRALMPGGEIQSVHVPDPGRLRELLYPGNRLLVLPSSRGAGKTPYSLLGAGSDSGWVLVNTSLHPEIAGELFKRGLSSLGPAGEIRREVSSPSGESRFDFLLDGRLWVEVKGCTLLRGNVAMFPDAPTKRGVKHLRELTRMVREGTECAVVFLVFVRNAQCFTVNRETDPAFAAALEKAAEAGVGIEALSLDFDGERVCCTGSLAVRLSL
jgi:sugar fermentation stimulation protein A